MWIEKALINDRLRVSKVFENFPFQLFIILRQFTREMWYFVKREPISVSIVFFVYRLNITT